ncbi:hypothetical protein C8Q74DRAFT_700418 [Fomes fomentarius]|nr:hypothetical protein C8Q74DRAFT_700418 [Fomes fomentarius]
MISSPLVQSRLRIGWKSGNACMEAPVRILRALPLHSPQSSHPPALFREFAHAGLGRLRSGILQPGAPRAESSRVFPPAAFQRTCVNVAQARGAADGERWRTSVGARTAAAIGNRTPKHGMGAAGEGLVGHAVAGPLRTRRTDCTSAPSLVHLRYTPCTAHFAQPVGEPFVRWQKSVGQDPERAHLLPKLHSDCSTGSTIRLVW